MGYVATFYALFIFSRSHRLAFLKTETDHRLITVCIIFDLFVLTILFPIIRSSVYRNPTSQTSHITQLDTDCVFPACVCVCGFPPWSHSYGNKPTVYKTDSVFTLSLQDFFGVYTCVCVSVIHQSPKKTRFRQIFVVITASISLKALFCLVFSIKLDESGFLLFDFC